MHINLLIKTGRGNPLTTRGFVFLIFTLRWLLAVYVNVPTFLKYPHIRHINTNFIGIELPKLTYIFTEIVQI